MIRINLLPQRRRRRRLLPESGVVSAVLLVIAALGAAYFYGAYQNRRVVVQTAAINQKLLETRPKVAYVLALEAQIEDMRARENLLRALEARELPWPEILVDLAQRTPTDAWLNSASTGEGASRLNLSGSALSYNSVARFMTNLAASRFYSDVDLLAAQGGKTGATPVIQFGLVTTLRPVGALGSEGTH